MTAPTMDELIAYANDKTQTGPQNAHRVVITPWGHTIENPDKVYQKLNEFRLSELRKIMSDAEMPIPANATKGVLLPILTAEVSRRAEITAGAD